jgi:hypothetical protein
MNDAEKTLAVCCLVTRTKNMNVTQRQLLDPVKMWQRSNIWELHRQIKNAFMRKLRQDQIPETLPTAQLRIFLPLQISKNVNININETIILSVISYGCETWSLTLQEGHRLWVSKNRMLKRILGS